MNRRFKLKSESAVFLVVLFGILVLVNVLSVRFFSRADLTRDGLFTLSEASVALVKDLDDKLVVKAYFTKDLPGRYATLERHVKDLLSEYKQNSGGKMTVEFIDPDEDEEGEEEETAKKLGIQKMPNPDIDKDQATIKEGYRGIAFSFGEKTEVIPSVESTIGLEYMVTTTLKKLVGEKPNVGFLIGHGEPLIEPPAKDDKPLMPEEKLRRGAYQNLRMNFDLYNYLEVNTAAGEKPVDGELDTLIVVGAANEITEKELYRIDQYLMSGGSVAMFVSGTDIRAQPPGIPGLPPTYETSTNQAGLEKLLTHYGVQVSDDLLFDQQSSRQVARCPGVPFPIPRPYPAWPIITAFEEDHPVAYRIGSVTLPYATPLEITQAVKGDEKRKATLFAYSSGNSWRVHGEDAVVDPCAQLESKELESGVPVAATVTGEFNSYFSGKDIPVDEEETPFMEKSAKPGRLLVVGSAALPMDESLMYLSRIDRRQARGNLLFVQNALDWLTSEDDLIAVRMKNVNDPPLEKGDEGAKTVAKWTNLVGVPLLFVLFGVVRWRVRASKRGKKPEKEKEESK